MSYKQISCKVCHGVWEETAVVPGQENHDPSCPIHLCRKYSDRADLLFDYLVNLRETFRERGEDTFAVNEVSKYIDMDRRGEGWADD